MYQPAFLIQKVTHYSFRQDNQGQPQWNFPECSVFTIKVSELFSYLNSLMLFPHLDWTDFQTKFVGNKLYLIIKLISI